MSGRFSIARRRLAVLSLVILVQSYSYMVNAEVRLPKVFGNHMVLQQQMPVPVWGWAEPGEQVKVIIAGQEKKTTATNSGKWMVKLDPLKAPGPYQMTVKGKNTVELSDILVGEVWFCSGQSNMDWGMNQVFDAKKEVAEAKHPDIRLLDMPYRTSGKPEEDVDVSWNPCTSETIARGGFFGSGFSGVAYYFGRELQRELKVPVGLVASAWGGTRIEPWTPPEGFAADPQFADIVKKINEATPRHKEAMKKALAETEAWLPKAKKALAGNKEVPAAPAWPKHELDDAGQPTGIYNGIVHPFVPYAIRGAIWYQGESNRNDGLKYTDRMKALIGGWRTIWGEGDFPFYYVQIAPYRYADNPEWTMLTWEAQLKAMSIPNTGMVVTTDLVDNIEDIHPKNKKDVGERLGLWALANTYGKKSIVFSGPLFDSMEIEGRNAKLKFRYAAKGLKSRDGKALTWFEIAGADKKFVKATAKIEGKDTIVVSSSKVRLPVAVRFAWNQEAMPNLVNSAGLPASPFRTDSW